MKDQKKAITAIILILIGFCILFLSVKGVSYFLKKIKENPSELPQNYNAEALTGHDTKQEFYERVPITSEIVSSEADFDENELIGSFNVEDFEKNIKEEIKNDIEIIDVEGLQGATKEEIFNYFYFPDKLEIEDLQRIDSSIKLLEKEGVKGKFRKSLTELDLKYK